MMSALAFGVFTLPLILLWLFLAGLSVYALVLFIKLAQRGIRALDIYISKNNGDNRII